MFRDCTWFFDKQAFFFFGERVLFTGAEWEGKFMVKLFENFSISPYVKHGT